VEVQTFLLQEWCRAAWVDEPHDLSVNVASSLMKLFTSFVRNGAEMQLAESASGASKAMLINSINLSGPLS